MLVVTNAATQRTPPIPQRVPRQRGEASSSNRGGESSIYSGGRKDEGVFQNQGPPFAKEGVFSNEGPRLAKKGCPKAKAPPLQNRGYSRANASPLQKGGYSSKKEKGAHRTKALP